MYAERLKNLYTALVKCRIFAAGMRAATKGQFSCNMHEAVIAGAAIHLQREDLAAPSSCDCLARLVQGVPLEALVRECSNKKIHLQQKSRDENPAPVEMAAHNIAAGMALACKMLHKPAITLYIRHEQQAAECWRDAVQFAAGGKLPLVFVVVTSSARDKDRFDQRPLYSEIQNLLPTITVDGNDVVAVYRVAEECTRRAREGLGPSLLECRAEPGRDPITFMENYLKQRNLWQDTWKQDFARRFTRELETAVKKSLGPSAARRAGNSAVI